MWQGFKARFGCVGHEPTSYWFPALGNAQHGPGLSPGDIGDLSPQQLNQAWEFMEELAGR